MPTSGSRDVVLVDTSVAIALVTSDHQQHKVVFDTLGGRRLGLSGHAAFETFSVLTRLPPPARRSPAAVGRILSANFPHSRFLPEDAAAALLAGAPSLGFAGGTVYDALVAATAVAHELPLATRDARALPTYRALDVKLEVIGV